MKVPVRLKYHQPVTEGYRVVATRGGELPEVNCQSVITFVHHMSNVNSIRPAEGTSLRALCEVRSPAQASVLKVLRMNGAGDRNSGRVLTTNGEQGKAAPPSEGGWRQNGRKRKRVKQGDLLGATRRSWPHGPKNRPAGVRASVVAKKSR